MTKLIEKNLGKSPLNILIISNEDTNEDELNKFFENSQIYLNIVWSYLKFDSIENWDNIDVPDVLFIDFKEGYEKKFNWELYSKCHDKNPIFLQVVILQKFDTEDYQFYKFGSDEIIYKDDGYNYLKWKIIAMLRRSWDSHSKKTTIIYKGMILDNIKNTFYFNDSKIHLTKKELQLMNLLMSNINGVSKRKIFKKLWDDDGEDYTRVVDQIIFKIKKKIGKQVFEIKKNGIKII